MTCPSHLHRYSIETMDLRWSNDGVAMEYLRRKNEEKTAKQRGVMSFATNKDYQSFNKQNLYLGLPNSSFFIDELVFI